MRSLLAFWSSSKFYCAVLSSDTREALTVLYSSQSFSRSRICASFSFICPTVCWESYVMRVTTERERLTELMWILVTHWRQITPGLDSLGALGKGNYLCTHDWHAYRAQNSQRTHFLGFSVWQMWHGFFSLDFGFTLSSQSKWGSERSKIGSKVENVHFKPIWGIRTFALPSK